MPVCYIALGGNLGDVAQTFDRALEMLRHEPGVTVKKVSSYHSTAAVGEVAGGEFLNAVAEIDTELAPEKLLDLLQSVEDRLGRMRKTRTERWGPRTLDLDILFYGHEVIDNSPRLLVPHPACWFRRFVLDPLAEIAPDVVHPQLNLTVSELRSRLLVRPLPIGLASGTDVDQRQLADMVREFPNIESLDDRFSAVMSSAFDDRVLVFCLANTKCWIVHPLNWQVTGYSSRHEDAPTFVRSVLCAALGQ